MTEQIAGWLKDRPHWMQFASKQLITKGSLTQEDFESMENLCLKQAIGEEVSETFSISKCRFGAAVAKNIRLKVIGEIEGINALSPKLPLSFGENNLSIVYGQNGAGKSGYVRILKHSCGARNPGELHQNAYISGVVEQKCLIIYDDEGSEVAHNWKVTDGPIPDLSCIDVFDDSIGNIYVTKDNEVTYEPPVLSFFSDLISVSDELSGRLDNKRSGLVSKLPFLPREFVDSDVGRWYRGLTVWKNTEEIEQHCSWTKKEEKVRKALDNRLSVTNPAQKIKQIEQQIKHSNALVERVEDLLALYSDGNIARLLNLKEKVDEAKKLADLVAKKAFQDAPVDGVGTEDWRKLWEIARKFSTNVAYGDKKFPYVASGARCVLCQQALSEDAAQRMVSFEEYVKGEAEGKVRTASTLLEEKIMSLQEVESADTIKTLIDASGLSEEHHNPILQMFPIFQIRKKAIESVSKIEQLAKIPKADDWKMSIVQHIGKLKALTVQYEEDSKKQNRDELQNQLKNLKAKQWLSQQRAAIEKEMTRLQYAAVLSSAKKFTSTSAITKKKGEIAQSLITDAFVARFNSELKDLGAAHINVELVKSRAAKGKVLHRIQLKNATQHSTENVLSEGERRIVSLSAFLADVSGKAHSAPFVFDDPISSLDQIFEEKVVQRLIDLSAEKQIIVFTHRLSLLGLMQDYAKKAGIDHHVVCIRKEMWGTGEPGDTPLFAKKPLAALNKLRNERLSLARKVLEDNGQEVYEPLAKALCSDFRIVIERMVECNLISDVVQRYRRDITTKNKIQNLSKITRSDCQLFDDLMSKYSTFEHSQPLETPISMPWPDELKADLDKLAEWHATFAARPIPDNISEEVVV